MLLNRSGEIPRIRYVGKDLSAVSADVDALFIFYEQDLPLGDGTALHFADTRRPAVLRRNAAGQWELVFSGSEPSLLSEANPAEPQL